MEGITHLACAEHDIWCLSDGDYVFDHTDFPSVDADLRTQRLTTAGLTQIETIFHAYLIRPKGGSLTLMDTGCGTGFGPKAGHLLERLEQLDVTPTDIETLVFSHLHSDHCGGAMSDEKPVFPNAQVVLHKDEPAAWMDAGTLANAVLKGYADAVTLVNDDVDLGGGIRTWALPGHTAGHMGLRIGDDVVLCADILHSDALQLPDPNVCSVHDDDPDRARTTRLAALQDITTRNLIFSGSHGANVPKFRKLRANGVGFDWIPL